MLEGITVDYMIQRNWAESWKAKLVEITIAEQKKMSEKKWQFIKTPLVQHQVHEHLYSKGPGGEMRQKMGRG